MAITLTNANRAISAAFTKAMKLSARVSVSVCDPYGHLIAHQRMDGAFAEASRGSIGKAIAAAEGGPPSRADLNDLQAYPRTGTVTGEGAPDIKLRGGLPIIRDGEVEGAVGVAGGLTNEQDDECARAAIASLKTGR